MSLKNWQLSYLVVIVALQFHHHHHHDCQPVLNRLHLSDSCYLHQVISPPTWNSKRLFNVTVGVLGWQDLIYWAKVYNAQWRVCPSRSALPPEPDRCDCGDTLQGHPWGRAEARVSGRDHTLAAIYWDLQRQIEEERLGATRQDWCFIKCELFFFTFLIYFKVGAVCKIILIIKCISISLEVCNRLDGQREVLFIKEKYSTIEIHGYYTINPN